MNALRARMGTRLGADRGMSLIEVVVAIAILAILSTASLGVYLSTLNASSNQQRREIAITIANESLETVNGWSTDIVAATGKSALYSGRAKADVQSMFATGSAVPGVLQTYPVWDDTAPASANSAKNSALPIIRTVDMAGTEYIVDLYIGTCLQNRAGGSCTDPVSPLPAVIPSTYTPLTRVIVNVRWTAGAACGAGCSYDASTLIDLNKDLEWNTH